MKKIYTVTGTGIDTSFDTSDVTDVYDAILNLKDGAITINCDTYES